MFRITVQSTCASTLVRYAAAARVQCLSAKIGHRNVLVDLHVCNRCTCVRGDTLCYGQYYREGRREGGGRATYISRGRFESLQQRHLVLLRWATEHKVCGIPPANSCRNFVFFVATKLASANRQLAFCRMLRTDSNPLLSPCGLIHCSDSAVPQCTLLAVERAPHKCTLYNSLTCMPSQHKLWPYSQFAVEDALNLLATSLILVCDSTVSQRQKHSVPKDIFKTAAALMCTEFKHTLSTRRDDVPLAGNR